MISYEIPFLFRFRQNLIIFKNSDRYRRLFSQKLDCNSSLITDPMDSYILTRNKFSEDPRDKKWLKYGTESYRGYGNYPYLITHASMFISLRCSKIWSSILLGCSSTWKMKAKDGFLTEIINADGLRGPVGTDLKWVSNRIRAHMKSSATQTFF